MERNMILERRRSENLNDLTLGSASCYRGKELDLYGVRPGSSTCMTREIAAEVRGDYLV